jgi:hypothetical protein
MKEVYPRLTLEQERALWDFADYAGRTWKTQLGQAWMTASMVGHLHALRNTHGPSWLVSYRLPKVRP